MASILVGLSVIFVLSGPEKARAQNAPVAIAIDAGANRLAINPLIYGLAFDNVPPQAQQQVLTDLNAPTNREGSDYASMYNWNLNASNLGLDWYYESLGMDSSAAPGEFVDSIIAATKAAGAQPMATIPMVGWIANLGAGRSKLCSFSTAIYGAQQAVMDGVCGNGLYSNGTAVAGNNPYDANIPDSVAQEQTWVQHLVQTWKPAGSGGLQYYILDNEPGLWYHTHADVHPVGPTGQEIASKTIATAAMIKSIDPTAKVIAPEEWSWQGDLYSGYDLQYLGQHGWNWSAAPDKNNNMGGMPYVPWLMTQWKKAGHPIDIVSLHYYPSGGENSNDDTAPTQQLRNRSTRSLWDPTYVDQSYINAIIDFIPSVQGWINSYYYPGTPFAITEYSWGDDANINGATAQADVLGIFGRQGLSMANRWTAPDPATPTYKAIKLYRNYDGAYATFGDVSVATSVPNPDALSAFSAIRSSDGALTVMIINKIAGATPVNLSLANYPSVSTVQMYQLTAANQIVNLGALGYSTAATSFTVPGQSITLMIFSPGAGAACGTHASGSAYTAQLSQTSGSVAATVAQCPYGGTQAISTTVTQTYLCSNGTQTAQGSPVSTVAATGAPSCNAAPKVNGTCGAANATAALAAPKTLLCSAGSASSVSGSGPFGWSCLGTGGGSTASCATLPVTAIAASGSTTVTLQSDSAVSGMSADSTGQSFDWGWMTVGGHVSYQLAVATAGTYNLILTEADPTGGQGLTVAINGGAPIPTTVTGTGSFTTYKAATPIPLTLPAGIVTLTLTAQGQHFNIGGLAITATGAAAGQ